MGTGGYEEEMCPDERIGVFSGALVATLFDDERRGGGGAGEERE